MRKAEEPHESCSLLEMCGWSLVSDDKVIYGQSDGKVAMVAVASKGDAAIMWTVIVSTDDASVNGKGKSVVKAMSSALGASRALGVDVVHSVSLEVLSVARVAELRMEAAEMSREHNLKSITN